MSFDWATICIEAIGLAILLTWIIVPIQEFQLIARRLQEERHRQETAPARESAP
jgi:hypothetical protein